MNAEEFKLFEATLKEKLPVTFRLNAGEHNIDKVSSVLRDPNFINKFTDETISIEPDEHASLKTTKIDYSSLRLDLASQQSSPYPLHTFPLEQSKFHQRTH